MWLRRMMVVMGVWLRVIPQFCNGIMGYECGSSASNLTTVSLLDVDECEIHIPILDVSNVEIQFLQLNEFTSIHVRQCKVKIDRTVFRCGMHSHSSIVSMGSYILETTRESCDRMQNYGTLELDRVQISGLKPNSTRSHSVTLAGRVDTDGSCEGIWYSDPFGGWGSVAVVGNVIITLRDYRARVGLENSKIYLNSGMRCELNAGNCVDMDGGPSFWDVIPIQDCGTRQYSVLYEGIAQKAVGKNSRTLYSLVQSDITFALTTLPSIKVCGRTLIRTEHPRLLIHEIHNGGEYLRVEPLDISNMDMFAYVNSKFVFVERHIQTEVQRLYHDVMMHKCNLEREMLRNRLAIATQSPDEFAYHLMKGPGYMAVLAGEVVHIIKCIPVEVRMQQLKECYKELPVVLDNKTYFMSPRTHILLKTGIQITCNKMVPPTYYIGEEWYSMSPEPTRVFAPETIKPMIKTTWKYKDTQALATSGIYTAADLDKLREHVMFPVEQPAVINSLAREIMGKATVNQGGSIANLLKGPEVMKIVETAWAKTWDKFMLFGHISAGLIGVMMILKGVKMAVDTIIHGYALHSVYGWSVYLLGAIWDSVTGLLLHLQRETRKPSEEQNFSNKGKNREQRDTNEFKVIIPEENPKCEDDSIDFKEIEGERDSERKHIRKQRKSGIYPFLPTEEENTQNEPRI